MNELGTREPIVASCSEDVDRSDVILELRFSGHPAVAILLLQFHMHEIWNGLKL